LSGSGDLRAAKLAVTGFSAATLTSLLGQRSYLVTYDLAGDPSLGSVFIIKAGTHPIP